MVKVSVIIPMYNTEAYIMRCLRSVMDQTYPELEILVIDDGSGDRGAQICQALQEADKRIVLLRQEHKGVSAARNKGLEAASGEYVFFLDSDDAVHPRLIQSYAEQAKKCRAEFLFCNLIRLEGPETVGRTGRAAEDACGRPWITGKKREAKEWFYSRYEKELSYIGGKMIRRDVIGKQKFDETLFSGEDTVFIHRLICQGVHMAYLDARWYYYRIRPDSITHLDQADKMGQKYSVSRALRDQEYQTGQTSLAVKWEEQMVWSILSGYLSAQNEKDAKSCQKLKIRMAMEMENDLYKKIAGKRKLLFYILYVGCAYSPAIRCLWRMKQRLFKIVRPA